MPLDRRRRIKFVATVDHVFEYYQRETDPIDRQRQLREFAAHIPTFNRDDYPDIAAVVSKPSPITVLGIAVTNFGVAINFSNYEKADKYFQDLNRILDLRDRSLDHLDTGTRPL